MMIVSMSNEMCTNPIQLWLFERSESDQFNFLERLNPEQLIKYNTLKGKRQTEFGFTRLLLNHIVGQTLNLSETFVSKERVNLPPSIPCFENEGWSFSISHSAELISIAVGFNSHCNDKVSLGVDIESLKKPRTLSAAKTFCSPKQLSKLEGLADAQQKQDYYCRLWTQKEAYFKARHLPVLNPKLKSLEINATQTNADLWSNKWLSQLGNDYQLSLFCDQLAPIEVTMLKINHAGEFSDEQSNAMEWTSYSCSF